MNLEEEEEQGAGNQTTRDADPGVVGCV